VTFDASATDEKGSFTGNTGPLNMYVHKTGTAVMVVNPRQTVTYYVANKSLDPEGGSTIPCLIRNQGGSEIIVADNIQRMKVAVSLDNGVTWHPDLASSQVQTWAQIKSSINADLASQNRQGFTTINSTPAWVRELPMLVRLDLTSLTSKARAEYSSDGKSLQKRETTQSLIIMPRYFGLSYF
jgi:hypothetical protein